MKGHLPLYVVGIDVETTALDPREGEIIEVAAIRYKISESSKASETSTAEVERFVRLCKPAQAITQFTTSLTGITDEMVAACAPFSSYLSDLQAFIGQDVVFAHNAPFDVKWLTYHGLNLAHNLVWDTFVLASVAWPEAESYNLGQLSEALGLHDTAVTVSTERKEHAAGFDVELTWQILQQAREHLVVSPATYKRIATLLERAGITHYLPLFRVSAGIRPHGHPPAGEPAAAQTPASTDHPGGVARDWQNIEQVFGKGGVLEQHIDGFVARGEQVEMAQAVQHLLDEERLGVIEAPTGTGKTYAYLAPVLLACAPDHKAIISTHTKHLQDQLIERDIPHIVEALGLTCQVSILKGRRNYLCTQRLERLLDRARWTPEEALLISKVLVWLEHSQAQPAGIYGDMSRLNISHQSSAALLAYLHADALSCRLEDESSDTCPYQLARRAAQRADLVIVNHALLVRMAHGHERALEGQYLVIDEAHQLEDVARQATMRNLSVHRLKELIAALRHASAHQTASLEAHIRSESDALVRDYGALVARIQAFMEGHTSHDQLRLTAAMRQNAGWQELIAVSEVWRGRLHFTIGLTESLSGLSLEDQRLLQEVTGELNSFGVDVEGFMAGSADRIQWLEVTEWRGEREFFLRDVALSASATLRPVFAAMPAVVLTSATLAIGGSFAYLTRALGISPSVELTLPSPFPLKDHLLIYLVTDGPNPTAPQYDRYIAEQIATLAHVLSGRILALFTARRSVKAVYYQLIRLLNKATIKLYAQDITGGRSNMLTRFRKQAASILLGTASFWEGIDIPGDSLSCVVVPRLPFANPYDPILEAVAEAEQVEPFEELSVPRMILRLRQGVGRLIRTATDRGVVIIYDPRMHRADYGRVVKKSLPEATVRTGRSAEVPEAVQSWIGEEVLAQWRTELSERL